jgi:hypothetical protein
VLENGFTVLFECILNAFSVSDFVGGSGAGQVGGLAEQE